MDDVLGRIALRSVQFLAVAAAVWVLLTLLGRVLVIVVPVILAVFLTTLLEPPATWLRRHGSPAWLATTSVVLGGLLAVGGLLYWLAPRTVNTVDELSGSVGSAIGELQDFLEKSVGIDAQQLTRVLSQAREHFLGGGANAAVTGVITLGEVLTGAVLTLVLAVYLVHGGERLAVGALSLLPASLRPSAAEAGRTTWHVLGGYVRGTALVGLVDAAFIGGALWLLDVSLAIPLTVLTFAGAFVPLVGAFVSGILAAAVALVDRGPTVALVVVAVTVLVQQLEGHILSPRVMSRVLDLSPVVVISAVTTGGALGGVLGAFLAVPTTAVLATLLRNHREAANREVALPGEQEPTPDQAG
jgi:predicted PurR-regulated permease PerM